MSVPTSLSRSGRRTPAAAALLVAILSVLAALLIWNEGRSRQQRRFEVAAATAAELVRHRLQSQIALLHGAAGLFAAAPSISCAQFGDFVARMGLEENYPGTLGMGFSVRTDAAGARMLEAAARRDGLRDFRVWPGTPRDEYHVTRCLEPLSRENRAALGYDMGTDAVRRDAMTRARDTGDPALSGRVTLVQEIGPVQQAGFLIYVPVYAGDVIPPDLETRRQALRGFVYSPLRGDDFLRGTFGDGAALVGIEVFDGDRADEENLLHRRLEHTSQDAIAEHALEVAGRRWTLRFRPAAALAGPPSPSIAAGVLASGWLLALLLYLSLHRAQRAAAEAAEAEARARASSELAARGAEQLALIMDAAPALVSFIDTRQRYVIVNRRYTEWFGAPRAAIEGRTVREVLGDDAYAQVEPALRQALGGRAASVELRLARPGVRDRFLLASYTPHLDSHDGVLGVVALLADITGQKEAQRTIAESEASLRAILNTSLDAVIQMDRAGRILFWNARAEEMFGWPPEEACGHLVRDLIVPPTLREAHRNGLERFLRTGEGRILGRRVEVPAVRKDGAEIPVELVLSAVGHGDAPVFSAFIADLSERKRAEDVRRFLSDAANALSSSLDRERIIEMIAPRAVPHLGTGAAVIVSTESGPPAVAARAGAMSAGDAAAIAEGLHAGQANRGVPAGVNVWPLAVGPHHMGWLIVSGTPVLVTPADADAVSEEYTRRASMALHHAYLYEQAASANRLKDEFLSTLSHELRTPANAILGWAQIARDGVGQGRDIVRALDAVLRNAHAQNDLIADILDAQRLAAGKLRLELAPLELPDVLRGALDAVRPAAMAKQIALEAHVAEACPVSGDSDRLRQVLWNLLSNAVKFTPNGGAVSVATRCEQGRAIVSVTDTGPGIPPDLLPHIFERFRQADGSTTKNTGGLGLGLAIAKDLVELHGGVITAANRDDGVPGAVVRVSLPVRE